MSFASNPVQHSVRQPCLPGDMTTAALICSDPVLPYHLSDVSATKKPCKASMVRRFLIIIWTIPHKQGRWHRHRICYAMQEPKPFSHGLESWVRRMQIVMGQANGTLHSVTLRPVRPEAQMVRLLLPALKVSLSFGTGRCPSISTDASALYAPSLTCQPCEKLSLPTT